MVNEQEEIKLGYLLDPCFELSNTAGKPLTNGWIEVYIHGTRNKYYCYSDFGGTLHPFKIPLDSLGSNIVLADPERAYDVYVYNMFGSLVMSRYNVSPGHAGGAAISSGGNAEHWIGRYGATIPVAADEYSDSIPLPIEPDYEGTFIDHISDNKNIVLKDGLYLVDCLLSFRQNPDSLNNTLGYVHVFTGLDDGESGVFQRNETLPDTDPDETHNIRVQFVRHVEGSTGCNVCFQVRTTNAWSFVRIQGLSIVKLGAGGGIAPQPIEYDAGQYVSIDNDVISVTGLQPSGNYADASSVSQGFYAVNQQLSALSGQVNEVSGQIPSLDGYATQNWVNDQGFLKEVPSQYVTENELNSAVSGKADKSEIPSLDGYATEEWVRQQNYLTEVPDGYATEMYVQSAVSGKQDELTFTYDSENKITTIDGHGIAGTGGGGGSGAVYTPGQYISIQNDIISVTGLQPSGEYLVPSDLNGYATDDDVQAAVSGKADKSEIPSLSGYATEEYVQSEVSGKADKSEIPSLSGYATEEWVGQQGYLTSVPSVYITETELESELSGKADVSAIPSVAGLASETYVDQHIEEATSGKADVSAIPSLSGYATESWVTEQGYLTEVPSEYVTETELSTELSGKADVSAIPSLQGYATETWVSQQGYATSSDVDEATSGKLDASAYVAPLNADWSATSGLSQILNKPEQSQLIPGTGIEITPSGSDYVISSTGGGSTYTEGDYISIKNDVISVTGLQPSGEYLVPQDLNGYATDDDVIAATSGKQDSLEFGYTSGGSVSAINNSGIYDSELNSFVIQNSAAWGGSAMPISGGPGVRIRIDNGILVAEADETVLFETSSYYGSGTINLSEPYTNFEKLKVLAVRGNIDQSAPYAYSGPYWEYDTDGIITDRYVAFGSLNPAIFERQFWKYSVYSAQNTSTFVWAEGGQKNIFSTAAGTSANSYTACVGIKKVIGINRKSGGN